MDQRPNILLVMPDQMRGDCLSLEGHPVLRTPHIDSIGSSGVHFTRGYTTCASCIPARRSLLTGQFPATNGLVGYQDGIPIATETITELLRDAGFATAIAGRCMHQSPAEEPYGFQQRVLGSVYVDDDDYARFLHEQAPGLGGIRGIGLSCNSREAQAWPVADELHPTAWVVREARKLLSEIDPDRPLFLAASFYAPHPPLFPPARYLDRFLSMDLSPAAIGEWESPPSRESYVGRPNVSRVHLQGEDLRRTHAGYFGQIEHMDDLVSDLLVDFKQRSAQADRPWLIVFTSDHGEMLGDHYLFRKCEPYEGASHIPFLIQGSPELGISSGIICSNPVCLEDIMPTFLELAGEPIPEGTDGCSLVPILRGEREAVRTILHGEHAPCYDGDQAYHFMTDGRMKYIWRPANGSEQLFDLHNDPHEKRNLKSHPDYSANLIRLRSRLATHLQNRPEGFSNGTQLISGCQYEAVIRAER